MENFFIEDKFYHDLTDLMEDLELYEIEEVQQLPDDWSIEVKDSTLEKIFTMTEEFIVNAIVEQTDRWEERFPEESDNQFKQIKSAIKSGIDVKKINDLLPQLYYPNGSKFKITKKDLIEHIS